jgi:hypothetical protein
MSPRIRCLLWIFIAVLLVGTTPKHTEGCAALPPRGFSVEVAEESAIIYWDAAQNLQHFIRRASFKTDAKDFGFLVPTPTAPILVEAQDLAFRLLATITAPEIIYKTETRYVFRLPLPEVVYKSAAAVDDARYVGAAAPVQVLHEQTVAGYDAAVLQASDASALKAWLEKNGYPTSPDLEEWLKFYIENRWTITAFKVSKDSSKGSNTAVHMTFKTDKPFFPYREPAGQRKGGTLGSRLLRIYFLADASYSGKIGTSDEWPGWSVWSDKVEKDAKALADALKLSPFTTTPWLTEFEDRSSPRPGTDEVYFTQNKYKTAVHRPPDIRVTYQDVNLFGYVVLLGLVGLLGIILFVVKERAARQ